MEQAISKLGKTGSVKSATDSSLSPIRNLQGRRIILLGKTGTGKSAAGNTILGGNHFHSEKSFSSLTRKTTVHQVVKDGRKVSVVDTPGLFDTDVKPEVIAKEIGHSVIVSSPGPHAFIIVMSIINRFTKHEKQTFEHLQNLFGSGMSEYAIILFTHGDQLEGHSMEKLINGNNDLRRLVEQCGGRYHVFNNTDGGNRAQVQELMKKIDRMVEENGGTCYTNEMFEDAAREKEEEDDRKRREEERLQKEEEKRLQKEEKRLQRHSEEIKMCELIEKKMRVGQLKENENIRKRKESLENEEKLLKEAMKNNKEEKERIQKENEENNKRTGDGNPKKKLFWDKWGTVLKCAVRGCVIGGEMGIRIGGVGGAVDAVVDAVVGAGMDGGMGSGMGSGMGGRMGGWQEHRFVLYIGGIRVIGS